MEFFDLSPDFLVMFSRLLLNVLATFIIIDRMYYRKSHRRDFYFTFMLIPIAIFFIVFFMIFVLEDLDGRRYRSVWYLLHHALPYGHDAGARDDLSLRDNSRLVGECRLCRGTVL